MNFDQLFGKHTALFLQTTDVQKAYQEFIRLFRFLRNELNDSCRTSFSEQHYGKRYGLCLHFSFPPILL